MVSDLVISSLAVKCHICGVKHCGLSYVHKHHLRRHQRSCHDPNQARFPCDFPDCFSSYDLKVRFTMPKKTVPWSCFHKPSMSTGLTWWKTRCTPPPIRWLTSCPSTQVAWAFLIALHLFRVKDKLKKSRVAEFSLVITTCLNLLLVKQEMMTWYRDNRG